MGQYFNPVIVDPTGRPLAALNPATYGAGPKLSTHTRADSPLMTAVEILLTLDGGARLVWAGDYEDPDDDQDALYWLVEPQHFVTIAQCTPDSLCIISYLYACARVAQAWLPASTRGPA